MKVQSRLIAGATALMLTTFASIGRQTEAIAQPKQEGVEVLTRGPIHEAFAQPTTLKPSASPTVAKKPPEPINEIPPEQRPEGDQMQWIPGYWAYDDERADYLWLPGIWRAPPPDRQWIPGYWQQAEGGYRWTSGYWVTRTDTAVELLPAPPDAVDEAIPPQPNVDTVYMPGIWVYRENRYWWQPGHWIACRAGWLWSPAHYCWTTGGYVFVNGFWDYDLDYRGICFAPVSIDPRVYGRSGWSFRPHHAIAVDFLFGSLFVQTRANQYFFGDYFDPAYARRGFTPWVDFRFGGGAFDPLFGYYRWQHRGDARWEPELRTLYTTRRDNTALRPPRTLAQQDKAASSDPRIHAAVSLEKWKGPAHKLEAVPKSHYEEILKHTEQWRALSTQRGKIETAVKPSPPTNKLPTPAPAVKIELPKTPIKHPEIKKAPPPHPELPKVLPSPPVHKDKKGSLDREGVSVGCVDVQCPRIESGSGFAGRARQLVPAAGPYHAARYVVAA